MASHPNSPSVREHSLRVFGYADLIGGASGCHNPLRGQAKHLALLIYLAVSKRGDFVAREDLLALLWPDADQDHARASLRQALACLRKGLGSHLVLSMGRHTVGLDRDRIWCDAREFDALLEQGHPEGALELYRGHFVEGFHISAGDAFEEWVDGRRAYYRARAIQAAWSLAEQAEAGGMCVEAAYWGKRAVGLAGRDELQIQRLLGLLDRVGDIPGATRAYRGLVEYLAREWGAAPSAQTERLFDRIRNRPGASSGPFSSPHGRRSTDRRRGTERRTQGPAAALTIPERRKGVDRRRSQERRSGVDRRADL